MLHLEFRKENPIVEISLMRTPEKHPNLKNYLIMKPVTNFVHQNLCLKEIYFI